MEHISMMVTENNPVKNKNFVLSFIAILLLSLDSFYFYQLSMPLFSVLGTLLICFIIVFEKIPFRSYHRIPLTAVFVYMFWSLITALNNLEYLYPIRIFFCFLVIPICYFIPYLINEKKVFFFKILRYLIIVHLVFFFLQFIGFYFFGTFIDYLYPVTGEQQRAFGGSYYIFGLKLIRATGLFNEPGTYSTFMFIILSMYGILKQNLMPKKGVNVLEIVTLISVLLTFSIFGFIFAAIYMMYYLKRISLINKIIFLVLSFPFFYIVYINYLIPRFNLDPQYSNGLDFRQEAINLYFKLIGEDFWNFVFGYSSFVDLNSLLNVDYPWNDVSLLFNIFVNFGLIMTLLIFICSRKYFLQSFLLFCIVILSKLSLNVLFIWLSISFIYTKRKQ